MTAYPPPNHLTAPFNRSALTHALQAHDLSDLLHFARQLRLSGYRVSLDALVSELLDQGCAWVEDSCGQPVRIGLSARQAHWQVTGRPTAGPEPRRPAQPGPAPRSAESGAGRRCG